MMLRIDPRDFISPPYVRCPKCGEDSLGVLSIGPRHYQRRCKNCLYPGRGDWSAIYPLPALTKRIIYVDQFAISNMMKALNPSTKAHKKGNLDPFWLTLFQHLDSLCKLQLAVCPRSGFHRNESLLSAYYEPLKQMYELLSCGVRFREHESIEISEICEHAMNWARGKPKEKISLPVRVALEGNLDGWTDTIGVSIRGGWGIDWVDRLREDRKRVCERLNGVVEMWKEDKDKDFQDWFTQECSGYGRLILRGYNDYLVRLADMWQGRIPATADDLFGAFAFSSSVVRSLRFTFQNAGFKPKRVQQLWVEYLQSASFEDVPFVRISAMLFAAVARKFARGGRRKPVNEGLVTDINIISVLMPYCDAAFIDNECEAYLREKPLCELLDYKTKVFSLNTRADFLEYLAEIRRSATKEHLEKVEEVYGPDAQKPYTTLYEGIQSESSK